MPRRVTAPGAVRSVKTTKSRGKRMKPIYFVRPIWRMFDFKGVTGRAEYLTYTITSFLVTSLVLVAGLAVHLLANINWHLIVPQEMLNDEGMLYSATDTVPLMFALFALHLVLQWPMVALTTRRLRDQYASWSVRGWFFIPFLGPVVLFGHGFAPTFRDYPVQLWSGETVMRSTQLTGRRFRNALIGAAVAGAAAAGVANSLDGLGSIQLRGGAKVGVNRKASPFKADGSLNRNTAITGGNRAHTRVGSPVRASRNRYKL